MKVGRLLVCEEREVGMGTARTRAQSQESTWDDKGSANSLQYSQNKRSKKTMRSDVERHFRIRIQRCLEANLENLDFICNKIPSEYLLYTAKRECFENLQEIKYFIHSSYFEAVFLIKNKEFPP